MILDLFTAGEKWFVAHNQARSPESIPYFGAYRTRGEAEADAPIIQAMIGPRFQVFVERYDDSPDGYIPVPLLSTF
ncbi:hypothetical protein [Mycobacteroides abscessus]|uniref:hypothetical protein n=1 Tax=Mycobacteroides abscessus TaxID=36809 RepID=UPI0009A80E4F|nr:hypothetical protein [Mycobacteroides abscessus]MDO3208676.1 hypothetical protein [Mycobacteroides abscessus subsp. massiliense]SKI80717.1 Uncharacterised protein [Mycobacteroides abscessus subsp. massiliense]SKR74380.1 Uncharacterised protein [Mycobacteroides abscessus subsp. massiliense]SKS38415.1 Uncharacterised protein [Mycobacteroides abscessus subsp. massiliense]SKS91296.1 Uncharacterised protein [Mycobacteroides abscessus subsp. massiliense]